MGLARAHVVGLQVAATLIIAGCASNPPVQQPATRSAPVVRSIAISPSDYVTAAASASLFIVKASEIIATREGDTGLGQFAIQFGSEQRGIGAQLSLAGRRLNLLPAARLLPRHQTLLDAIAASPDPSDAYLRHLASVIPQALALHRQYERYGTSPTLRPVAAMAAPIMQRHLSQLRGL